ncbi:MAG: DUF3048 domain-containing protein [Candidatus Promineifilaceae bacterium]|nr:DUF3048 domain-containing protein [Candidatus Promineifilaceae bacterium]
MFSMRTFTTLLLATTFSLLVACNQSSAPSPDAPPEATATGSAPGDASGAATATTAPTATVTPTAAPVVIASTPTPAPTATPGSAATAAPAGLIGPDNFPENVNPLTGEVVADPAVLDRRPVAVKISNYPPIVRPQSGLNNADLIYEHYAEGGVTRFTAVFYGKDADPIGSIRSGRLIDLEIPKMYDAAFAYAGSSGPIRLMMRNVVFFDRIITPDFGHGGFYRIEDPNKAFEHTLFTDTPTLRAILEQRGQNTPPSFSTNMAFSEEPPQDGTPAAEIEVRYNSTNVFWNYDPASGRYFRWTDGEAHNDANTGQQLNTRNVVVVAAHHVDTTIVEDRAGNRSIEIQIWGEGPVSIFRDGQRFDGRWRRENEQDMLTFYDEQGNVLPLAPGNSFFQMVPLGFTGLVVSE